MIHGLGSFTNRANWADYLLNEFNENSSQEALNALKRLMNTHASEIAFYDRGLAEQVWDVIKEQAA